MTEKHPDFNFPASSLADWLEAARQELGELNPMEKLSQIKGSISIKPYYDASSASRLDDYQQLPSPNLYYGARCWMNTPRIEVADEKKANELALSYLQTGADGILFEPVKANLQLKVLLDQVKPEFCTLSFLIRAGHAKNAFDFSTWVNDTHEYKNMAGCLFWENYRDIDIETLKFRSTNFSPFGLIIPTHDNAEDEIAFALGSAVHLIELIPDDISRKQVIGDFAFSVSIGTDIFREIAKLKALRNLWYQVQGAYGIAPMQSVHIHARSTVWTKEGLQPHGNMIKSTVAGLSAISGGCDSLTIEPENNNQMETRIARNVSSILREESYLAKVADPTAGSYYLDSLVTSLSEKAWQKFQLKMKP